MEPHEGGLAHHYLLASITVLDIHGKDSTDRDQMIIFFYILSLNVHNNTMKKAMLFPLSR